MQINIQKFEKKLKLKINNKKLFIEAFTHKSANNKKNNEKLEFLGDRVIGLVLSKKLFVAHLPCFLTSCSLPGSSSTASQSSSSGQHRPRTSPGCL